MESLPFPRGTTANEGQTPDVSVLANLEGQERWTQDVNPATGVVRSAYPVLLRCVRNVAAAALLPKRLVTFQASAGYYGSRVDGYSRLTAVHCYPVDEYLPAAGVPVNDLFWIVIYGPALVLTDIAASAANLIPVGTRLVSLTAATSGATTAGRVSPQDLTGATALLGDQVQNRLGFALSAATTANTNTGVLCHIGRW